MFGYGPGSLRVIDISDPVSPTRVGGYETLGFSWRPVVAGDLLFVPVSYTEGSTVAWVEALDISAPETPVRVGGYVPSQEPYCATVANGYLYLPCWGSFDVVSYNEPANPQRQGGSADGTPANAIVLATTNLAYAATLNGQFDVYDISDPQKPLRKGGTNGHWSAAMIAPATNNTALITDEKTGLYVVGVSNPAAPVLLSSITNLGGATSVAVSGNLAFFTDFGDWNRAAGLQVVDLSSSQPVSRYATPAIPNDIWISGNTAYVADVQFGLVVLDISNPAALKQIGSYSEPRGFSRISPTSNNRVFLSKYPYGEPLVVLLDISDPQHPSKLGQFPHKAWWVLGWNDYVICTTSRAGLQVLDFSDPANPRRVGGNDTFREANQAALLGDLILTAAGPDGIGVLQMQPFFKTVSATGDRLALRWDAFGSAQLQRTSDLRVPQWQTVPVSETTNAASLQMLSAAECFRLVKTGTGMALRK